MEFHIICRIKKDRIKNGKPKTVKLFASRANGLALSVVDQLVSEWILCSVLINTENEKNIRFVSLILFFKIIFYFRRRICWTQEKLRAKPSSSSHDHHLPISGAAGKNNFFASLALYKIFLNCSSIKS